MTLDHAWHEGRAGKFDHLRPRGRGDIGTSGGDAVALDEHGPAFMRYRVHTVEDAGRAEEKSVGGRGRAQTQDSQQR